MATKKIKPIKIAPGKYSYKGYTIKSYGSQKLKDELVWKAFSDETEELKCTGKSLHEVVNLIDQK